MIVNRNIRGAQELAQVLDWAAAEGWNPGLSDAQAFLAADPAGFFVATDDADPVAAISVVNHCDSMAFLGLYLCLPAYRGRGIGYELWRHALAHAGTRTVGLDGVAAQQANYARSGFLRAGSTRRFEGALAPAPSAAVRRLRPEDAPAILALDAAACGYARPAFLRSWIAPGPDRVSLRSDGGFVTARQCRDGIKIGPVVAPTPDEAMTLARAALAELPPGRAIIDLPEHATGFEAALTAQGFAETFATARMYRGSAPESGASQQAIATMELG